MVEGIRDTWHAVRSRSASMNPTTRGANPANPGARDAGPAADLDRTGAVRDHPTVPLSRHDDVLVTRGVRVAAAWSWRLLVIAVAVGAGLWLLTQVRLVVVPLAVALLLSALLEPAVARLRESGLPGSLAAAVVLIGGLAAVIGTLTAVVQAFVDGFPELYSSVREGITRIETWLRTGPLGLSRNQLNQALEGAGNWLDQNRQAITGGAVSTATQTASTVGHLLAGLFLVLFTTFFFMRDGRVIWGFLSRMFPRAAQGPVYGAGNAAWRTLTSYVRATVLVAFIDGVGIGLAALVLGLPLWFPIAALVFLASFVPIIGATVSGLVAVLVALVTQGPFTALLMLIAVVVVQQVEGHLLQPLLLGRAVALHPVAVIIAIAIGVVAAGIVGALIAVPVVAVLNTAVRYLGNEHRAGLADPSGIAMRRSPAEGE
jgi:predicted PurR-regulated permease PerM